MITSLSSWRAWIEISGHVELRTYNSCRSPHGERGLKSKRENFLALPSGRSPHGERGLKLSGDGTDPNLNGRSPHGERGLKYAPHLVVHHALVALLMESVD